jgi:hypothetical protein
MSSKEYTKLLDEHCGKLAEMASDHFDDLKVFDRVKVVQVLSEVLEDPEKVVEELTEMLYSARVESYQLGMVPMKNLQEQSVEGRKERTA